SVADVAISRDSMKIIGAFELREAMDHRAENAVRIHCAVLMIAVIEQMNRFGECRDRKHAAVRGGYLLRGCDPGIYGVGTSGWRNQTMFCDKIANTNFGTGDGHLHVCVCRDSTVGIMQSHQDRQRIADIDEVWRRQRHKVRSAVGNNGDEVVERDVLL